MGEVKSGWLSRPDSAKNLVGLSYFQFEALVSALLARNKVIFNP